MQRPPQSPLTQPPLTQPAQKQPLLLSSPPTLPRMPACLPYPANKHIRAGRPEQGLRVTSGQINQGSQTKQQQPSPLSARSQTQKGDSIIHPASLSSSNGKPRQDKQGRKNSDGAHSANGFNGVTNQAAAAAASSFSVPSAAFSAPPQLPPAPIARTASTKSQEEEKEGPTSATVSHASFLPHKRKRSPGDGCKRAAPQMDGVLPALPAPAATAALTMGAWSPAVAVASSSPTAAASSNQTSSSAAIPPFRSVRRSIQHVHNKLGSSPSISTLSMEEAAAEPVPSASVFSPPPSQRSRKPDPRTRMALLEVSPFLLIVAGEKAQGARKQASASHAVAYGAPFSSASKVAAGNTSSQHNSRQGRTPSADVDPLDLTLSSDEEMPPAPAAPTPGPAAASASAVASAAAPASTPVPSVPPTAPSPVRLAIGSPSSSSSSASSSPDRPANHPSLSTSPSADWLEQQQPPPLIRAQTPDEPMESPPPDERTPEGESETEDGLAYPPFSAAAASFGSPFSAPLPTAPVPLSSVPSAAAASSSSSAATAAGPNEETDVIDLTLDSDSEGEREEKQQENANQNGQNKEPSDPPHDRAKAESKTPSTSQSKTPPPSPQSSSNTLPIASPVPVKEALTDADLPSFLSPPPPPRRLQLKRRSNPEERKEPARPAAVEPSPARRSMLPSLPSHWSHWVKGAPREEKQERKENTEGAAVSFSSSGKSGAPASSSAVQWLSTRKDQSEGETEEEGSEDELSHSSAKDNRCSSPLLGPEYQAVIPRLLTREERLFDPNRGLSGTPFSPSSHFNAQPVELHESDQENEEEREVDREAQKLEEKFEKQQKKLESKKKRPSNSTDSDDEWLEDAEEDATDGEEDGLSPRASKRAKLTKGARAAKRSSLSAPNNRTRPRAASRRMQEDEADGRVFVVRNILCRRLVPGQKPKKSHKKKNAAVPLGSSAAAAGAAPSHTLASYQYYVSWSGYNSDSDSWEPYESVRTILLGWSALKRREIMEEEEYAHLHPRVLEKDGWWEGKQKPKPQQLRRQNHKGGRQRVAASPPPHPSASSAAAAGLAHHSAQFEQVSFLPSPQTSSPSPESEAGKPPAAAAGEAHKQSDAQPLPAAAASASHPASFSSVSLSTSSPAPSSSSHNPNGDPHSARRRRRISISDSEEE